VSANPFRDMVEGRFDALADRELARLGLSRRARLSPGRAGAEKA